MNTTYNPMSLVGKAILVTGASSGIGQAIAIECSKLGATVICTARNEERLQATLSMMEGEGHSYIAADLTDSAVLDLLVEKLPKLDGVSHNAGMGKTMLTSFAKDEEVMRVMTTNTLSVVQLQTRLLKKRKMNKKASLVFMASIGSTIVSPGNTFYGMSKAAIVPYVKGLAHELGKKGIRANSIHPGMVETPLIHRKDIDEKEAYEIDKARYPLGRYGEPQDIAHLAAFLLSDASAWITGSQYVIDGGRLTY